MKEQLGKDQGWDWDGRNRQDRAHRAVSVELHTRHGDCLSILQHMFLPSHLVWNTVRTVNLPAI